MVRCVKMKQLSFLVLAVCLNFSIALQCPFHSKRISEMSKFRPTDISVFLKKKSILQSVSSIKILSLKMNLTVVDLFLHPKL